MYTWLIAVLTMAGTPLMAYMIAVENVLACVVRVGGWAEVVQALEVCVMRDLSL